jgi:hypothetical protein
MCTNTYLGLCNLKWSCPDGVCEVHCVRQFGVVCKLQCTALWNPLLILTVPLHDTLPDLPTHSNSYKEPTIAAYYNQSSQLCATAHTPSCAAMPSIINQELCNSSGLSPHPSAYQKGYSFCLMVEASDHGYVLHTRRIHVTRYRRRYDMIWCKM